MASLACERDDGKNAVFVGTFLETGTSIALCEDDLINFVVSMSQQLTGAPVIDFVSSFVREDEDGAPLPAADDAEGQYQLWLNTRKDALSELMELDYTFEEAVAFLLAAEAEINADDSPDTADAN